MSTRSIRRTGDGTRILSERGVADGKPVLPERGTADVIVVGGGLGGMTAALVAAREGASVVLLEARDEVGGNAAVSTGYIAFAGFSRQRDEGIEDDPARFLADMLAEVEREQELHGIAFDEAVARTYAERSSEAYDFLCGLGMRFGDFVARPRQHTTPRMLALRDTASFRTRFEPALRDAGVRVVVGTHVERLLTDGVRVVGVRAVARGGEAEQDATGGVGAGGGADAATVASTGAAADGGADAATVAPTAAAAAAAGAGVWRARRAVVLAAGGYQANHELRARFQPVAQANTPYYGVDTARGDGHLLGAAVGGQLVNMTCIPMYVRAPSALVAESIAVNADGVRFHDEPGPYLERVAALRAQPGGVAWYLFDERVARERADLVRHLPIAPLHAPTVAGIAAAIGCDAAALERTVAAWNELLDAGATAGDATADGAPAGDAPVGDTPAAAAGDDRHRGGSSRDRQFGRRVFPTAAAGIVEAPFHAAPLIVGASFTAGGLQVTRRMEVSDLDGSPIPGLLAVGDCVGAVNPAAGLGGIHLGSAVTLGMVAGRTAASA